MNNSGKLSGTALWVDVDAATGSVACARLSSRQIRARFFERTGKWTTVCLGVALCVAVVCGMGGRVAHAEPDNSTVIGSKTKAVVELFTSQGCSSCPRADRLLQKYVERSDVVALSFPVNIWDYLGWTDTFATQMNSERQRGYARSRGQKSVYTPQVVVNGVSHFTGFHKSQIDACIEKDLQTDGGASLVPLRLRALDGEFVVEAGAAPSGYSAKQMMFWIAAVQSSGTVDIKSGENRGNKFTYHNIVRSLTPIGSWDGKAKTVRVAKDLVSKAEADRYVVLLQKGSSGPIIGASWLSQ